MMLTIGSASYFLSVEESSERILDEVVSAAHAGAGIIRFATHDGAMLTAVVTPYIPVIVSDRLPVIATAEDVVDDVGISFVDFEP